jgi:ubiquinone/menaquinone biosynthesis C-methylase UbiE
MKKITRKNLSAFLKGYATTELILDVGAGSVSTNHSYTQYFPNRHTIDIDEKRQPDTIGDIHELPFEDNSYGFIVCTEVLEHCHTPQKAIEELYRVLKPGGTLILTTRFVYPLHDVPHDYFRFTKYGLQHLFREWKIIEIVPETNTFSAIGALVQRVGFQTSLKGGKLTKGLLYISAEILDRMNWLLKKEYGDIARTSPDDHIMTTGYYVVAQKE